MYYLNSLISGLKNIKDYKVIVYYNDVKYSDYCFECDNIEWRFIEEQPGKVLKLIKALSCFSGYSLLANSWNEKIYGPKPDLIITQQSLLGFYNKIPFLGFVGDIMYKYFPNLDEYSPKRRFLRDFTTKRVIEKSLCTVVDSEYCKKDLIRFFDVDSTKIIPIPLCAPPHIYLYQGLDDETINKVLSCYKLPDTYLFYPAQFWEHKNHLRIVDALNILKKKVGIKIPIVFVGSQKWEGYYKVLQYVSDLGINDQVFFLGYVSDKDIVALYKRAKAFVYGSYGDYTGIPIIEAMVLMTPVLSSNCFSLPTQLGDAGLLFDPYNSEDIALKILEIWDNSQLRRDLIHLGALRASELSPDNFSQQWINIIKQSLSNG